MIINFRRSSLISIYFCLLLILLPILTLFTFYTGEDGKERGELRPSSETLLNRRIIELKEKLNYIEMINQQHMIEVHYLRNVIETLSSNSSLSVALQHNNLPANGLIDKTSFGIGTDLMRFPSIVNFLPHLGKKPELLQLAFRRISSRYPSGKMGVSVVLGVPTVKRPIESYLITTVRNLIDNLNFNERNDVVIVVFIAETDMDFIHKTSGELEKEFGEFIDSGLLEVIAPPANYYPDFNTSRLTLNDPLERVIWRSKQNLDFALLMMYCQPKGVYYVQLEDDVLTKPGYLSKMKNAALKQSSEKKDWFIIEFCSLGFIGKMIKTVDLPILIIYFIMFYNDQPVDWLLYKIGHVRYCRLDDNERKCRKAISHYWVQYRPSLFQHIGTHSSLKGKIQKLREKSFGKVTSFNPHTDNPTAVLTTSIKQYQSFSLIAAYQGYSLFWGLAPKSGDYILVNFTTPIIVEKYFIKTSNWEHPEDKFYNTTVQVWPLFNSSSITTYNRTTDGYLIVGHFKHATGIAEGSLVDLGAIKLMKLYCHSDSDKWVLINEILIRAKVS